MGETMKHNSVSITETQTSLFNPKGEDLPSSDVADFIQPIINVAPYNATALSDIQLNTNATVTLSSTKTFYMTGYTFGYAKDNADDSTNIYVVFTPDRSGTVVSQRVPLIALTAGNENMVVTFPRPFKLSRGSTLGCYLTGHTVGNIRISFGTTGYYE